MNSIEELIQRAIEEGKFDDLPGKGKPLRFEENPYEDPDWRAAFRILRNAGFSLPWIETRKEIEHAYQAALHDLKRTWEWYQTESRSDVSAGMAAIEWESAKSVFHNKLVDINNLIRKYNLDVPTTTLQLPILKTEREIEALIQGKVA